MFAWIAALIYSAFLIIVRVGLRIMPRSPMIEDDESLPTVSVVIAARDEETRIGRLLDALEAQDYPREKFDVIVIDDRSSDRTGDLVRERRSSGVRYQVLRIREEEGRQGRAPKKYALARGIEKATGDVIVTTDADCWMGSRWLRALAGPFVDPDLGGATGVSRFVRDNHDPKPWWSDYESLEHLSYSVMAAGAIGAGHVQNAHGSNLAARREVYDRIGGYGSNDKVASGDDVFLLQDVMKHGGKVIFIDRPEGYVFSKPVETAREWVNQRARWSSKGFYYPPFLAFLLVGTFGFYAAATAAVPLALFGRLPARWATAMIGMKLTAETHIMQIGARRFGERLPVLKFLITELLHSPAIFYAGIRGQFFSFTWKGQRFNGLEPMRSGKSDEARKAS
jgi:cellulose synthase/poly-beta-1,6-N-acetylglucosamine synthase-like glycosyltransferase